MPPTYLSTLSAFTSFLTAYTHTILYLRTLYPRTSFVHSRFHNTSVYQSRHPLVCEWIRDAISAVHDELLTGSIARIAIVIFTYPTTTTNDNEEREGEGEEATPTGSAQILERYMLDVSRFPVVAKQDRARDIEWEPLSSPPTPDKNTATTTERETHNDALSANLSEQFRAALIALTTRTSRLAPLPTHCSFNISMELKDEADVDPPLRHPTPWVPVQPSLQKTGRKGRDEGEGSPGEGAHLGGVRVTPIRSVEAGVFMFETWVEEGKAKFEGLQSEESART